MILQQLWADADAIMKQTGQGEALPSMYQPKLIRWEIRLHSDERITPTFFPLQGDGKKGLRGLERIVPDCKRTAGVRPILLADKTPYTLGVQIADPKKDIAPERTAAEHAAYRALIHECAEKTGNAGVGRIAKFLDSWKPESPSIGIPSEMTRDDLFVFLVNGENPADDPKVQAFWASYGRAEEAMPEGASAAVKPNLPKTQCLVSGAMGPIEEMMPVSVKGIPGGQAAGMQIVSANAAAFESYGLKRAQTSPISRDAGERFGKALNALIASERHHQRAADITYVFWSRAGVVPMPAFSPPEDTGELRRLVRAPYTGEYFKGLPNAARFYMFGLSPNAARVVVRSMLDTTVGAVIEAQANWFDRLSIIGGDGQPGRALPLKTLTVAPYRDFKDIAPNVEDVLVRAALNGDRLPDSLLQAVVLRCRLDTENRVTYPRAALLKYMLTQDKERPEDTDYMSQEITGEIPMPPAYHCGRLFAELEDIQRTALPGINATISDRYFGAASSAPASVFGTLLSGARDHLGKLRKTQSGAYINAERRLEEILAEIQDFPHTLILKDQALFSLGYYHHKAAKRKDIAERSAAKKQAGKITQDTADTNAPTEGENS
jgi:CRISPR-associated protein Csd1